MTVSPLFPPASPASADRPHVIVFGNEKGGTGKSTSAVHVLIALARLGYRVGALDLDARQATLARTLENRRAYCEREGLRLVTPPHRRVERADTEKTSETAAVEQARFEAALAELGELDAVVIDTPGSDSNLSRLAHSQADTLVTPLNDSFLDLDLLARIDPERRRILGPSLYSQMVWEQRQQRARSGRRPIDWIVMRNRLSHIDARSKRDMARLLETLSRRIGFRLAPGFGERVIFRELFPKGLTLLDLREDPGCELSLSHVAARQEVRALLAAIGIAESETVERAEAPAAPAAIRSAGSA